MTENNQDGVLDVHVLAEMSSGSDRLDEPVLVGLIALFLREETPRLAELGRLAAAREGRELARTAHKLAGSCAVIGATQMCEMAQALERTADAGAWDDVAEQLVGVRTSWIRLRAALAAHHLAPL
jgi:HPt (histidine-containing phosphotransfer) domain-containing protein